MSAMHMPKTPPELAGRFAEVVASVEGLEPRTMFGYPAAFLGGNLTTSLHGSRWIVRLAPDELEERMGAGWEPFEPMPGRPMRGYVVVDAAVVGRDHEVLGWVERAATYVRTLPPKPAKARR
jgi:hypothetical protein